MTHVGEQLFDEEDEYDEFQNFKNSPTLFDLIMIIREYTKMVMVLP